MSSERKVKILLINPPGWQDGSVSLGLACLSGALLKDGHEVKVFDFTGKNITSESIAEKAKAWKPELIGLHVKTSQANIVTKISGTIKEIYPDALQVAGGPHVTLCYEDYLKENPHIEYGFSGEADLSFPEFCRRIKEKKSIEDIPGVIFRKDGTIVLNKREMVLDLDSLAHPCFDVIEDFNWSGFRYPLLTSRGCPYGCNFCSVPIISSKRFRMRHPEDCVEELKRVKNEKRIATFEILDDNFTFNMGRAKDFCRALIKADLRLSWHCHNGIRADRLDDELGSLMGQAGCASIAFGIETGDPEVFQRIHKGENLEQIARAIQITKKAKMQTVGYFIIGLPGDSLEAVKRTIVFQKSLKLDHYVYGIFIPYPGTRGQEEVLKEGRLLLDIRETSHFSDRPQVSMEYSYFTKDQIEEAYYLAAAGDLLELIEEWKIKGPVTNVLYVEMNPPMHAFRRFSRWVEGGVDLLINAVYDGCFELDKNEGWVRQIYTYQHSPHRWQMIRELIGLFWVFRKKKYNLAFFPFNRRKSMLLFFLAIVSAKHTVLYDFEGSRFVDISLRSSQFRSLLKRYIQKKFPNAPLKIALNAISYIFEKIYQRVTHIGVCLYLYFWKPASLKISKEGGENK